MNNKSYEQLLWSKIKSHPFEHSLHTSWKAPQQGVQTNHCQSTKLACLIAWFFVYEVYNIQLNKGLPQEFDVWDIFVYPHD